MENTIQLSTEVAIANTYTQSKFSAAKIFHFYYRNIYYYCYIPLGNGMFNKWNMLFRVERQFYSRNHKFFRWLWKNFYSMLIILISWKKKIHQIHIILWRIEKKSHYPFWLIWFITIIYYKSRMWKILCQIHQWPLLIAWWVMLSWKSSIKHQQFWCSNKWNRFFPRPLTLCIYISVGGQF